MRLTLIGTGSAHDPDLPNASALVEGADKTILIDCGFSAVRGINRHVTDPDRVDLIVVTHHHPDHVFGFVPLIDHWSDSGRTKTLKVATTQWGRSQLESFMTLAFGPLWRPKFNLVWHVVPDEMQIGDIRVRFAPTLHSVPNHAIRFDVGGKSLAYSGDGAPTASSRALFAGVDFLMHECYVADDRDAPGHCNFPTCLDVMRECAVGRLGLYHIHPDHKDPMKAAIANHAQVCIPRPDDMFDL